MPRPFSHVDADRRFVDRIDPSPIQDRPALVGTVFSFVPLRLDYPMKANSEARLLARTLALRQARAMLAKHQRLFRTLDSLAPDITGKFTEWADETTQALKQIDEALK